MILILIKKIHSRFIYEFKKLFKQLQIVALEAITDKWWLLDWLPRSRADSNSVMLVRLDVIGDFILWLNAAKEFRTLFPEKKIVLYANSSWAELAERLNHWDEVVSVDMKKLRTDDSYRLKVFKKIHRRGFNIAIQPTFSREYMGDMLLRASSARVRIGSEGDVSNIHKTQKRIADTWYTELIKACSAQTMELQRNAEFMRGIGLSTFKADVPCIDPLLELPANLSIKEPYVVIVPGASWVPRMWPLGNFAALIKRVNVKSDFKFVLCGSPDEYELCEQLSQLCGLENIKNFAGKTTLSQLVEVIRHAQFVFANETSSIHIATATQTPSFCILGGGHFGRFLPYKIQEVAPRVLPQVMSYSMECFQCNWNCIHITDHKQTVPCIKEIEADKVVKLFQEYVIKH